MLGMFLYNPNILSIIKSMRRQNDAKIDIYGLNCRSVARFFGHYARAHECWVRHFELWDFIQLSLPKPLVASHARISLSGNINDKISKWQCYSLIWNDLSIEISHYRAFCLYNSATRRYHDTKGNEIRPWSAGVQSPFPKRHSTVRSNDGRRAFYSGTYKFWYTHAPWRIPAFKGSCQ